MSITGAHGATSATVTARESFSVPGFSVNAGSKVTLKVRVDGEVLLKAHSMDKGGYKLATVKKALTYAQAGAPPKGGKWDYKDFIVGIVPGVDAALVLVLLRGWFINARNGPMNLGPGDGNKDKF